MLKTNKPKDHPIHTRYNQGIEGQYFLQSSIEKHLGESIVWTTCQTDTMDAESKTYWIEIKRRLGTYHYSNKIIREEGWVIPVCKMERARQEKKKTRFYYFWDSDQSLWYWEFNPTQLRDMMIKIPTNHRDNQPHYYIPQSFWKKVEMDCLID